MKHSEREGVRRRYGAVDAATTPVCPECHHLATEIGESHYPDCRFYALDEERSSEEESEIFELVFSVNHRGTTSAR
jgi:hypothetical protein